VWGEKLPFNTVCGEYSSPSGGWVHSVGFSPSGDVLAFASGSPFRPRVFRSSLTEPVGHDSTINIVYPGGPTIYSIRSNSLPYISLTWTSEDAIVAAGHDCQPVLFSGGPSGWQAAGSLDDTTAPKSSVGGARGGFTGSSPVGRLNSAAFNTFRNADSRGMGSSHGGGTPLATDTELFTVHQNTITNIRPYDGPPGAVSRVSTSGVDGKLVIWSVNAVSGLGTKLKALRVG
jgi:actin related protein 2/3 complex subunit 1A/1B